VSSESQLGLTSAIPTPFFIFKKEWDLLSFLSISFSLTIKDFTVFCVLLYESFFKQNRIAIELLIKD
jgi:hypothetical protein